MADNQEINDILEQFDIEQNAFNKVNIDYHYYKQNVAQFIDELVYIEDKDVPGVAISFDLWEKQKDALNVLTNNRRSIILKARQLGLTWLALSYGVHTILFNEGNTVNAISQTESDGKELIRRIDFILRFLPNWLVVSEDADEEDKKQNMTGITFKKKVLDVSINRVFGESSKFKAFTSSPGAARSFTANMVIMDEWAFHPQAEKIWTAAYPTIHRPTGGKIIGVSTGEQGTLFEDLWEGADWEFMGETGAAENSFKGIFLPWDSDPRRTQEWYEQAKSDLPNTYMAEYPSTPSEAFTVGKGAMFPQWDRRIHVINEKGWYPPDSWRIVLGFDGGWRRAAAIWYAISNDGWVVAYREYYPRKKSDHQQAEDIRRMSRDPNGAPEQISYIIADTSCWSKDKTGETTVDVMESHGIRPWRQASKEREQGWRRVHDYLQPVRDEEGNLIKDRFGYDLAKLRFTPACGNTMRIMPALKFNENNPQVLEPGQEDHLAVNIRYFVMSLPRTNMKSRKQRAKERNNRAKMLAQRNKISRGR